MLGSTQRITFANSWYVRAYSAGVLNPTCHGPSTSLPMPQMTTPGWLRSRETKSFMSVSAHALKKRP